LIATQDIDPLYPLLKRLIAKQRLKSDDAHWLLYTYLCFYNAPSAWAFFREFPDPGNLRGAVEWEHENRAMLHVNIERRGLRGGLVVDALQRFANLTSDCGITAWIRTGLSRDPAWNFDRLWSRLQSVKWVGRWAAYKWIDLLTHVSGLPIEARDLRLKDCSGPRQALAEIYGTNDEAFLDGHSRSLKNWLAVKGLPLRWDELETVLCNFHSMAHGRYYVGHDIDENLHDINRGPAQYRRMWLDLRYETFQKALLGELNGWDGVRKDLKSHFKSTGHVYVPVISL
jgi:hypothetical protein